MVDFYRMQAPMKARVWMVRNNRGQALVEFALILPLVMLILIGIVEFGRAWQAKQTLTDVAREGARIAAIANPSYTQDTVRIRVDSLMMAAGFLPDSVTIEYPDGCRFTGCAPTISTGQITSVRLSMPHYFVALHRLMSLVTNNGRMVLTSTARMRVE
jgi:general stress protein CsbA